jgi:hypothetical protein
MVRFAAVALVLTSLLLVGCHSGLRPAPADAVYELRATPASDYPRDAPAGDVLDIVVRREGRHVRLNNRTAVPHENVQIWLNRQYAGNVSRLHIGDANRIRLSQFANHFGEPYPVGGLLTPDRNFPIVLAEIYDPTTHTRHQLLSRDRLPPARGIGEE